MPKDWTQIAESSENYDIEDFKRTAYRLVTEQALYEFNQGQRVAYRIVKEHERAFGEMCALLGMELRVMPGMGFACAWPVHERTTRLNLPLTLLALVLRRIYHEQRSEGADENGRVVVSLEGLETAYEDATQRDFPSKRGELEDQLRQMRRFGIARAIPASAADPQPIAVEILPAIELLIDEHLLANLEAHAHARLAGGISDDDPPEDDTELDASGEGEVSDEGA